MVGTQFLGERGASLPSTTANDDLRGAKLDQLRGDIRQGLASGSSETWDAKAVKRKAQARRASKPTVA